MVVRMKKTMYIDLQTNFFQLLLVLMYIMTWCGMWSTLDVLAEYFFHPKPVRIKAKLLFYMGIGLLGAILLLVFYNSLA